MPFLDSDILIAGLKGDKEAKEFVSNLVKEKQTVATTVINAFELLDGAFRYEDQKKVQEVELLLKSLTIFNFTSQASWIAAKISSELKKTGNIIDFQDIAIASIVMLNNEELITRNIDHFKRISGLKVRKW